MNKIQEVLRRLVFDAEIFTSEQSSQLKDTRDEMVARVNRTEAISQCAIGVELIASRGGWETFTDYLITKGLCVETRRWNSFNEDLYRYDLYVEQ